MNEIIAPFVENGNNRGQPKFPDAIPYEAKPLSDLLNGPDKIDWLVDGIIPRSTITVMAGPSGVGKTWLILDLILAIASGTRWLGKFEVGQGPVLVVDEENAEILLRARLKRLTEIKNIDIDNLPIYFVVGRSVYLSPTRSNDGTITPSEPFGRIYNTIIKHGPVMTIFDSFTRVHRLNESNAGDMALLFSQIKKLVNDLGTAPVFTHHLTKAGRSNDGMRIRGSGDIIAAPDQTLLIEKKDKHNITVIHSKARWDREIEPFEIALTDDDDNIALSYTGEFEVVKRNVYKSTWNWLAKLLQNGNKSRQELMALAQSEGICSQRTLDNIFRWRCDKGHLEKIKQGRKVAYRLGDDGHNDMRKLLENAKRLH